MFIEYPDSQYHEGIQIDEYNGTYSLALANEGNDGKVYKKWCFPQGRGKGAGPIDKCVPMKIELGKSAEEAVAMLMLLLDGLREDAGIPREYSVDRGEYSTPDDDGDLPF